MYWLFTAPAIAQREWHALLEAAPRPAPTHTHTLYVLIMGLIHRTWASHALSFGPNHISGPSECLHITKPSSFSWVCLLKSVSAPSHCSQEQMPFLGWGSVTCGQRLCAGLSLSCLLQASCHMLLWVSVAPICFITYLLVNEGCSHGERTFLISQLPPKSTSLTNSFFLFILVSTMMIFHVALVVWGLLQLFSE